MKKNIILAVPYMYGLDQCIEKNLRFLGFDVINLCYDDRDSYYPNLGSRLKNLYHKHITKDGNYKKYLKYSRHLDDIQQKLALLMVKKPIMRSVSVPIFTPKKSSPPSANTAMFV